MLEKNTRALSSLAASSRSRLLRERPMYACGRRAWLMIWSEQTSPSSHPQHQWTGRDHAMSSAVSENEGRWGGQGSGGYHVHQFYVNQDLPPLIFPGFCLWSTPYEHDALGPGLPLCIGTPSDAKHSTSCVKGGAGGAALQVAQCCAPWLTSCKECQVVLKTMLKACA